MFAYRISDIDVFTVPRFPVLMWTLEAKSHQLGMVLQWVAASLKAW